MFQYWERTIYILTNINIVYRLSLSSLFPFNKQQEWLPTIKKHKGPDISDVFCHPRKKVYLYYSHIPRSFPNSSHSARRNRWAKSLYKENLFFEFICHENHCPVLIFFKPPNSCSLESENCISLLFNCVETKNLFPQFRKRNNLSFSYLLFSGQW